ncbi:MULTISPECIES: SDR family NAD(P)-dependent oxidoreductase [Brevibacterium]|uniref:2-hydroxycyclohexanecarboxyl-CoA dehydrogenase n=1 Tax=Brevibacterium aurantiacum TaxID=273384 RepID=A0A2A3ZIB7_BREAU|nr:MULTISPECIES: 3-oxoacyl-ACP reductase family protein [Brevibacterium]MDN5587709.1 3-oxoacyl-ACP reductase FabG [Brevibacterium sp.]MDN6399051.1 3-oxoacyl-ACP reductase FabG [Brachybacterium sp.]AZL04187.1 3-oxoacyl-ACP reductase FabG [Brevibacterium aurantiacum]AZL11395.1 3-oxoacyl-ACP reductase FabG [Brevibacterium aurantiacum]AZT95590.1 3-oxoacyl-ACP reductase FabG [Brevibacterium aurantiacum]
MSALDNRIIIVTGAASGIGKGIATRLAADGATVVVADLDEKKSQETASALGNGSIGIAVDVTDRAKVDAMTARTIEEFGRIDVLVNNAGWDKVEPFMESTADTWDRVIAINLIGTLNCTQSVASHMIAAESGAIISIGSDAGRVGSSGEAVYSAAKGGIISFTKTFAREVARHNITANCVCPGPADTPLFAEISADNPKLRTALEKAIPMRRLAHPDDLANAVSFFAQPESAYVTGQTLSVSGGLTMA